MTEQKQHSRQGGEKHWWECCYIWMYVFSKASRLEVQWDCGDWVL